MVRPDRRHDRIAVGPGVVLDRKAAFVRRDPAGKVDTPFLQFGPQVWPVEIKTDSDADAAKVEIKRCGLSARFDPTPDLFLHRIVLAIAAHKLPRTVKHQGLVVVTSAFPCNVA